ncbi:thioredoxin domain-containing protein [Karstenula rhodostoma CBS 690.94]|uniref:Thioredoxin domain-containing protein n=1 Tax=Karstenula rhodostoma CBS 690.94 TaxID=1392251 RepID=A0A9P4P7X8_9PLEO|nr:thioredoxin domain-containing protein [Karstenula rhodostoma CBS 690.94]
MVTGISEPSEFRNLLNNHTYLIADFFATWCPPCKAIAPLYEQLSKANSTPSKVTFVKINIDEVPELAAQFQISAIPTFLIFKDGVQIEEIRSANAPALKKNVEKIAVEVKGGGAQEKKLEFEEDF